MQKSHVIDTIHRLKLFNSCEFYSYNRVGAFQKKCYPEQNINQVIYLNSTNTLMMRPRFYCEGVYVLFPPKLSPGKVPRRILFYFFFFS